MIVRYNCERDSSNVLLPQTCIQGRMDLLKSDDSLIAAHRVDVFADAISAATHAASMAFLWHPNQAAHTLYGAGQEHGGPRWTRELYLEVIMSKKRKKREERIAGVGVTVASREWAEG